MDYGFKTERLDARDVKDVERAARILREGGTVAFPTETVYGLGANALSAEAVEKIFVAKQRPHWDPLIVHVCDLEMLSALVTGVPPELEESPSVFHRRASRYLETAKRLMEAFWPGPLTLLLPRTAKVPDAVTAGRELVGVRMPKHQVARRLIALARVPIAAPSANLFGHTSPTTASHVLDDLDGRIDAVLDGGATEVGLESTVAEVVDDGVVVYRAGAVDLGALESLNDVGFVRMYRPEDDDRAAAPRSLPSPGTGIRHYAPRARLVLVGGAAADASSRRGEPVELSLVCAIDGAFEADGQVGVMLPSGWHSSCARLVYPWGYWGDGETLARRLFSGLRELDRHGASVIVCPVPELPGIGEAIRDRLEKAARS